MVDKQKQIGEMAVLGCVRTPKAFTKEECSVCDFKNGSCNAYGHAEALCVAGYRKQSDTAREILGKLKFLYAERQKNIRIGTVTK